MLQFVSISMVHLQIKSKFTICKTNFKPVSDILHWNYEKKISGNGIGSVRSRLCLMKQINMWIFRENYTDG